MIIGWRLFRSNTLGGLGDGRLVGGIWICMRWRVRGKVSCEGKGVVYLNNTSLVIINYYSITNLR